VASLVWAYRWTVGAGLPDQAVPAVLDAGAAEQIDPAPRSAAPPRTKDRPVSRRPSATPTSSAAARSVPATAAVRTKAAAPTGTGANLVKSATASSVEGGPWLAKFAVDGDLSTRWSSAWADPQWIRVDLGRQWRLAEVRLVWEAAHAVDYRVETSADGRSWRRLWATTSGAGGTVRVDADGATARYVRMYGTRRVGSYGYSLLEFEVR
jgi:hypothetical protein